METVYIQTYDVLNSDISFGVDIYDLNCDMIGEGYYHIPFSSLVFKDLTSGEMVNIKCSEGDVLSVVCDYFGNPIDHIL